MEWIQKEAEFLGRSLQAIRTFPDAAKDQIGFEIHKLQCGEMPTNFKPVKTVGAGVFEIIVDAEKSWFRTLYVVKFEEAVYILHAFEKKRNQTSKQDIETGKENYKALLKQRK